MRHFRKSLAYKLKLFSQRLFENGCLLGPLMSNVHYLTYFHIETTRHERRLARFNIKTLFMIEGKPRPGERLEGWLESTVNLAANHK